MKKILILTLSLANPLCTIAKSGHDPVKSWWNSECLQRGPLSVVSKSDNQYSLSNETCQAGNTILALLEKSKEAESAAAEEEGPSNNTKDTENNNDSEWKNSVDAAHIITPSRPDQSSIESTVLGKIRKLSRLSLLGELHAARTLYTKPTQEEAEQKRAIIQRMANSQSLFNESKEIRDTYSPTIESATKLHSMNPHLVQNYGTPQWQLDWLGSGKLLGCTRMTSGIAIPTFSALFYAYQAKGCLESTKHYGTLYLDLITLKTITLEMSNGDRKRASALYSGSTTKDWLSYREALFELSYTLGILVPTSVGYIYNIPLNVQNVHTAITNKDLNNLTPMYAANHELLKAAYSITQLAKEYPELKNMKSFSNVQKLEEKMSNNKEFRETIELLKSEPDT